MANLAFKNILPKIADNNFQGHRFALWGFILFTLLMSWRAIIHMLFEQYGFHQIANFQVISGDPDPMLLIYRFFSLWGFAQLIFCIVCWIVIFRYKSLIPLMLVFWLIEWSGRLFLYPLIGRATVDSGIYSTGNTPGVEGAPYVTILLVIFLILSLREKK